MTEATIQYYINLSPHEIETQLIEINRRVLITPGSRQVKFNAIETLLCYGLFEILDPHKFGGRNQDKLLAAVKKLAHFFRRPSSSITIKMLNLDGSRKHSARSEVVLYAYLSPSLSLIIEVSIIR